MNKKIYLDSEFKCHVSNDGTMIEVETDFFAGKCDAYIEGYRFVPEGYTWTQQDGITITGETITPWIDHRELRLLQLEYENDSMKVELESTQEANDILTECVLEMSMLLYA